MAPTYDSPGPPGPQLLSPSVSSLHPACISGSIRPSEKGSLCNGFNHTLQSGAEISTVANAMLEPSLPSTGLWRDQRGNMTFTEELMEAFI